MTDKPHPHPWTELESLYFYSCKRTKPRRSQYVSYLSCFSSAMKLLSVWMRGNWKFFHFCVLIGPCDTTLTALSAGSWGLEESTVLHVENWLDCQAQRTGINVLMSCWWLMIVSTEMHSIQCFHLWCGENTTGTYSKFAERLKQREQLT